MSSRRFRQELTRELPQWQERGWLTPEGASALRATYELDRPPGNLLSVILSLLGSGLLLGGMILILAHNWEDLSRGMRAGLSVLPLLCTLALGFWALLRRPTSLPLAEGLALANSLALSLAISLVAQTYQISGDLPSFLLTWALFTLALSYLLGSAAGLLLFHVLASCWAYNCTHTAWVLPGYLALLAASAPFFLPRCWGATRAAGCRLLRLPLFLCVSVSLPAALRHVHGDSYPLAIYGAWFGLCYLLADSARRPLGAAVRWLSALGLALILVIFSFREVWGHLSYSDPHWWRPWDDSGLLSASLLLFTLQAALCITAMLRRRTLDLSAWLWFAAGSLGFFAWLFQPASSLALPLALGVNALVLTLGVSTMLQGIHSLNTLRVNLGWLLLTVLAVCRFFDTELSFLFRGVAYCLLGLGFLGLNLFLARRARRLTALPSALPSTLPSTPSGDRGTTPSP